jgi:hypothetical protein
MYDFAPDPSEFPYEDNFIFYFISVRVCTLQVCPFLEIVLHT